MRNIRLETPRNWTSPSVSGSGCLPCCNMKSGATQKQSNWLCKDGKECIAASSDEELASYARHQQLRLALLTPESRFCSCSLRAGRREAAIESGNFKRSEQSIRGVSTLGKNAELSLLAVHAFAFTDPCQEQMLKVADFAHDKTLTGADAPRSFESECISKEAPS
eukprot:6191783-Pleurochrysis_carterae.AAC.1